jgi:hypothetical protein
MLTESQGCIKADGIVVRYAAAWIDLPDVAEYALLRAGDALPMKAHLPTGDRIVDCKVTLDGREIDTNLDSLRIPEDASGRAALNITVETENGLRLGLSRSIQVLPANAEVHTQLTGKSFRNVFQRTDNCRTYLEDNNMRLQITKGSSSFHLPMMKLHANQPAWVTVKVASASAAWGIQLYLNSTGEYITILPEWQRTGEYLVSLDNVLRDKGLEQANVKVMFTLASGGTGEVTLEELTVYTEPQ